MSIEAIDAVERYVRQREHGLPFSEIVRRCEEFVAERDKNDHRNIPLRYAMGRRGYADHREDFAIREGLRIEKVKL